MTFADQATEPTSSASQVAAIIAAAGLSRRMGAPKQLLPWGERTVIATVVQNLSAAGASPVVCVVGHRQEEVRAALQGTAATIVFNPNYTTGEMLSSYQIGIDALTETQCTGALVALGDQPHIEAPLIRQVIEQARQTPQQLVIPSYHMRRGHPFYVPRQLWAALLALNGEATLRTLLVRHAEEIVYVNVDSDAILRDMDTPTDYANLKAT